MTLPPLRLRAGLALSFVFILVAPRVHAQAIDPSFNPGADAQVYALGAQPAGRVLVGGSFSRLAGQVRQFLGRLNANGTLDATFTPGVNGVVEALVVQPDGKILLGGQFTAINGVSRNRIARLNADGSLDVTFDPGLGAGGATTSGAIVFGLALQPDGKIVLGGSFETVGSQTRNGLARLNADGSLDAGYDPEVTGLQSGIPATSTRGVFCMALQADGKILCGGQFSQVAGVARNGFARVNADGSLDTAFNPSTLPTNFSAVAVQADGKILVGGGFSTLSGVAASSLARLNPDGTFDPSFIATANATVARIFVQADGRILVAGFFTVIGGQDHVRFARLTPFGTADSDFNFDHAAVNPNFSFPVATVLALGDGSLIVGGNFDSLGGVPRANLARLTPPTPSRLVNLSARAFVAAGGDLTIGTAVRGTGEKALLLRGVGPTLGAFGLSGVLVDPQLEAIPTGTTVPTVVSNDWSSNPAVNSALSAAFAAVGAFALPPGGSKDAALVTTLASGGLTARVSSAAAGASGTALAEIYDRDATGTSARLVNLSVRGFVGTAAQPLVPGFVIGGQSTKRLLVRAIGPTLATFGVGGILSDPQLTIIPSGTNLAIATNNDWGGDATLAAAFTAVGAFVLPANSKDAATIVQLPPGAYTIVVTGTGGATGQALVELYDLDP